MGLPVRDIMTAAGMLLSDTDATRWTPADLLVWIRECHATLASDAPAVCMERGPQAVVEGPVQTLPAPLMTMVAILGLCDDAGEVSSVLTQCGDRELFLENPAWMSDAVGIPVHYAKAVADLRKYYLYPPMDGAGFVLMDYVSLPLAIEDMDIDDTELEPFDVAFLPIFTDYVLYRAFGIDSDNISNMELSVSYFQAYQAKLTAYAQATGSGAPQ